MTLREFFQDLTVEQECPMPGFGYQVDESGTSFSGNCISRMVQLAEEVGLAGLELNAEQLKLVRLAVDALAGKNERDTIGGVAGLLLSLLP